MLQVLALICSVVGMLLAGYGLLWRLPWWGYAVIAALQGPTVLRGGWGAYDGVLVIVMASVIAVAKYRLPKAPWRGLLAR